MNEKLIERKLREGVRQLGGMAIKITSPSFTGLPDRMVLMPGGRIWYVELKTTGRSLSPRQRQVASELKELGFDVRKIDNQLGLDNFFNELKP